MSTSDKAYDPDLKNKIGVARVPDRPPSQRLKSPEAPVVAPNIVLAPTDKLQADTRDKMNGIIASPERRTASGRIATPENNAPVFPAAFGEAYKKKPGE